MAATTTEPGGSSAAAAAEPARRSLRITYAMPLPPWGPVGGFRVVYQQANGLTARGHRVTVVHPIGCEPKRTPRQRWGALRERLRLWRKRGGGPLVDWFPLDPRVRALLVDDLRPRRLPDADVLVATSWHTARWVAEAPATKGSKFSLVQHYEVWAGDAEEVNASLRLPLHKLVIAGWLADVAESLGEGARTTLVGQMLDLESFGLDVPLEQREPRAAVLWHPYPVKAAPDAVEALEIARRERPELRCLAFGVRPRPEELPDHWDYVRDPSPERLRALYNSCSIFVQPSRSEGWGLTATEAMTCGCALVTTDNGGSRDYALAERTALVVEPGDVDGLARAVVRLLDDDGLRRRLASAGHAHVLSLRPERTIDAVEAAFLRATEA